MATVICSKTDNFPSVKDQFPVRGFCINRSAIAGLQEPAAEITVPNIEFATINIVSGQSVIEYEQGGNVNPTDDVSGSVLIIPTGQNEGSYCFQVKGTNCDLDEIACVEIPSMNNCTLDIDVSDPCDCGNTIVQNGSTYYYNRFCVDPESSGSDLGSADIQGFGPGEAINANGATINSIEDLVIVPHPTSTSPLAYCVEVYHVQDQVFGVSWEVETGSANTGYAVSQSAICNGTCECPSYSVPSDILVCNNNQTVDINYTSNGLVDPLTINYTYNGTTQTIDNAAVNGVVSIPTNLTNGQSVAVTLEFVTELHSNLGPLNTNNICRESHTVVLNRPTLPACTCSGQPANECGEVAPNCQTVTCVSTGTPVSSACINNIITTTTPVTTRVVLGSCASPLEICSTSTVNQSTQTACNSCTLTCPDSCQVLDSNSCTCVNIGNCTDDGDCPGTQTCDNCNCTTGSSGCNPACGECENCVGSSCQPTSGGTCGDCGTCNSGTCNDPGFETDDAGNECCSTVTCPDGITVVCNTGDCPGGDPCAGNNPPDANTIACGQSVSDTSGNNCWGPIIGTLCTTGTCNQATGNCETSPTCVDPSNGDISVISASCSTTDIPLANYTIQVTNLTVGQLYQVFVQTSEETICSTLNASASTDVITVPVNSTGGTGTVTVICGTCLIT